MQVLIHGANFVNKGAEAMLRTVQSELEKRFGKINFWIDASSLAPGTEEYVAIAGLQSLKRPQDAFSLGSSFLKYIILNPNQAKSWLYELRYVTGWGKVLANTDLIIDVSGYAYADEFGLRNILRTGAIIEQAERRRIPFVFLPQAWGPFDNDYAAYKPHRQMCEKASLIFARDRQSHAFLSGMLQKTGVDVKLAPDIAFRFQSSGYQTGHKLIKAMGLEDAEYTVCIAPNMRVYERSEGFGSQNLYLKTLIEAAEFFLERQVAIILVPHEIKPDSLSKMDDRMLCELIRLKLGQHNRVAAITNPMTAEDIKAVISCCDLMVGSRFHALIAALQSRVPVLAMGWSHKYEELLHDVGLNEFVFDNNQSIEIIEKAWDKRSESKRILDEKIPLIEAQVTQVFDLVTELRT